MLTLSQMPPNQGNVTNFTDRKKIEKVQINFEPKLSIFAGAGFHHLVKNLSNGAKRNRNPRSPKKSIEIPPLESLLSEERPSEVNTYKLFFYQNSSTLEFEGSTVFDCIIKLFKSNNKKEKLSLRQNNKTFDFIYKQLVQVNDEKYILPRKELFYAFPEEIKQMPIGVFYPSPSDASSFIDFISFKIIEISTSPSILSARP